MSIRSWSIWIALFTIFCSSTALAETIDQMKARADSIIAQGPIVGRQYVDQVFQTADALASANRNAEAANYYLEGLRIEPDNFEYHLRYAKVLANLGRQSDENIQTQIILSGCEDPAVNNEAQALIGMPNAKVIPFENVQPKNVEIVLVPLGDVDLLLLQQEQQKLHDELNIDVQIRSLPVVIGGAARHLLQGLADELRPQLQKLHDRDPDQYARQLNAAGLTPDDFKDDARTVQSSIKLMRAGGNETAARQLEAAAAQSGDQWSGEDLNRALAAAEPPNVSSRIRFIGITSNDIFLKGTSFVFGTYADTGAIVSYRRFLASFNDEMPSRVRLLRRFHSLCLAEIGHVFGLERCTNPTCPRCYVHSLEELDLKADHLCDSCRKDYEAAFAAVAGQDAAQPPSQ